MNSYEEAELNKKLARVGSNLDALRDRVPLTHYGPGGCDGVDPFETYNQIADEAQRAANYATAAVAVLVQTFGLRMLEQLRKLVPEPGADPDAIRDAELVLQANAITLGELNRALQQIVSELPS